MIVARINSEKRLLVLDISGQDFYKSLEVVKNSKLFSYDPSDHSWSTQVNRTNVTSVKAFLERNLTPAQKQNLNLFYQVIDMYVSQQDAFIESQTEQSTFDYKYIPDILKFPAKIGKKGYENFAIEDVTFCINHKRAYVNWETGLGKSWVLCSIYEHVRHYEGTERSIIFTSNVGLYNLKKEILKFSKTLKPEEIYVYHSYDEDNKDLDIRDAIKPQYKLLILSYDALRVLERYYQKRDKLSKALKKEGLNPEWGFNEWNTYKKSLGLKKDVRPLKKRVDEAFAIKRKDASENLSYFIKKLSKWLNGSAVNLYLDESACLIDSHSIRSKNMFKLKKFAYRIYCFSATPGDIIFKLYTQAKMLDESLVDLLPPGKWADQFFLDKDVFNPIYDTEAIMRFQQKLSRLLLNREFDRVVEVPPLIEIPIMEVPMSDSYGEAYDLLVEGELMSNNEISVLTASMIVQMFFDNPSMLVESKMFDNIKNEKVRSKLLSLDYQFDNRKLEAYDAVVEEESPKGKGIIWTYHPKTRNELIKHYTEKGYQCIDATKYDKEALLKLIDEVELIPSNNYIFFLSIISNSTSITLSYCTWQLYAEKTYNTIDYIQSMGRIHRVTQKVPARSYTVRYEGTNDLLQEQALTAKISMQDFLTKGRITKEQLFHRKKTDEEYFTEFMEKLSEEASENTNDFSMLEMQ